MKKEDIEKYILESGKDYPKYNYYRLNYSIIEPYVKNWSKNRIQCDLRIQEMINNYYIDNHLDFHLHLAFLQDEKMVCYDGNHRMQVLNQLLKEGIDNIINITVMWECSNEDIYKDFKNLNKQSIVPNMYIENAKYTDKFKKDVDNIVEKYKNKYNTYKHFKPSNNPKPPHIQTDLFKNIITRLYDDIPDINKKSLETVEELLKKYNLYLKEKANDFIDPKKKIFDKCYDSDLWLFIKKDFDFQECLSFL